MTDKQNLLKVIGILYCARLPVTSTVMILLIMFRFFFMNRNTFTKLEFYDSLI
jgi:hypothetical protein